VIYSAEKKRLFHELVIRGTKIEGFDALAKAIGISVPDSMLTRWRTRFYSALPVQFNATPLLVNRFCVGADPEFIFAKKAKVNSFGERVPVEYVHAETLDLSTLEAFGADMSGRQAELRAYPSRSVLKVVASMMDEMRWLNEAKSLDNYDWIAPAIFSRDGVGGHVHIGRKRPHSETVIQSLDGLTRMLLASKMFDGKGQESRHANTGYGRYGDYRRQAHGFEYRTMPSWLCTPWCAYLTLVLAKLAVLENFLEIQTPKGKPELVILNLLRAYQGVDDDARIALTAMQLHGMPVFHSTDFKPHWGIPTSTNSKFKETQYFPPVIEPADSSVRQLFNALTAATPIPRELPEPTWRPITLPPSLAKVSAQAHAYGTADVAMGLIGLKGVSIARGDAHTLHISDYGSKLDSEKIKKKCQSFVTLKHIACRYSPQPAVANVELTVYVPANVYNNASHAANGEMISELRELLADSGLFPIARYADYKRLLEPKVASEKKKDTGVIGKIVFKTV
jgi:Phage phiEco32-like COOH.NH2 ligase-type 2